MRGGKLPQHLEEDTRLLPYVRNAHAGHPTLLNSRALKWEMDVFLFERNILGKFQSSGKSKRERLSFPFPTLKSSALNETDEFLKVLD